MSHFLRKIAASCVLGVVAAKCYCDNGVAADDFSCKSDKEDTHKCESCFDGFELDLMTSQCQKAEECVCTNGTPAVGDDCVGDNEEVCSKCDDGFSLDDFKKCIANMCTCTNGEPATGEDCTKNQAEICEADSCFDFFHFGELTKLCEKNECECEHGTPTKECKEHGNNVCDSCESGFELNELGSCVEKAGKVCTCEHGTPATGADCTEDGEEKCAKCDVGFHLESEKNTCNVNVCTCENGTAAEGEDCKADKTEVCTECNSDFELNSENKCEEALCQCANGTPVSNSECNTDLKADQCDTCFDGYDFPVDGVSGFTVDDGVAKPCEQLVCSCEHGKPAEGVACAKNREELESVKERCASDGCEVDGYHYEEESQICEPNVCTCKHGKPVQPGPGCAEDGFNSCLEDSCDDLYHFDEGNCDKNVCKCENGTLDKDEDCKEHDTNICKTCDEGYELLDTKQCAMHGGEGVSPFMMGVILILGAGAGFGGYYALRKKCGNETLDEEEEEVADV